MDPSVSCPTSPLTGLSPAHCLFLSFLLAHLFPCFTFVWSYSEESAGATGCDTVEVAPVMFGSARRFAHQLHAEYIQMWITHGTDMRRGIIWNQLSTRVSLAALQDGLRKGQGEFPVSCRADVSFDFFAVTCKPMTCVLAEAPKRSVPTSSGDLPTPPVISWVVTDDRRISAVRATLCLALLEHLICAL